MSTELAGPNFEVPSNPTPCPKQDQSQLMAGLVQDPVSSTGLHQEHHPTKLHPARIGIPAEDLTFDAPL